MNVEYIAGLVAGAIAGVCLGFIAAMLMEKRHIKKLTDELESCGAAQEAESAVGVSAEPHDVPLDIGANDTLIIHLPIQLSAADADNMAQTLDRVLDNRKKTIILMGGMEIIGVIRRKNSDETEAEEPASPERSC